jgi:hypothetical protein
MEQEGRPLIVNANGDELAIICPEDCEICDRTACYDSYICLLTNEKVTLCTQKTD